MIGRYFPASLIVSTIDAFLPPFTKDKVFFLDMKNAENKTYRMEVYRPNGYTGVYLRELAEDRRGFGPPAKFSYHDSCWRTDGIERVLEYVQPEFMEDILSDGVGLKDAVPDEFANAKPAHQTFLKKEKKTEL